MNIPIPIEKQLADLKALVLKLNKRVSQVEAENFEIKRQQREAERKIKHKPIPGSYGH